MVVPKISVIMPVYNSESYMQKSIDSVLNQTLKEIELICINDKSIDKSLKLLKKIQKKDNRLVILNNERNCGPGSSRNNGILKARGDYLMFVDSDDWLEIDSCKKLYDIAASENSDVIYIRPKIVFDNKIVLDKRLFKNDEIKNWDTIFRKNLKRKVAWAPWSKMIKRRLLISNKIFFPSIHIAEDMVFSVKLLTSSKNISECKDYLYNYLIRNGSLMSFKNSKRRIENYFESIRLVEKILRDNNLFDKFKNDFAYFKLYTYLAIYGVMYYSKEKIDKKLYKDNIFSDQDFRIFNILSCSYPNPVVLGSLFIKFGLFNIAFYFREQIKGLLSIGRK